MNPELPNRLAAKLRDNPSLLEEMDDALLGELIFLYHEGDLNIEDAAHVDAMLQTSPKAKAIHQRLEAADSFIKSQPGRTWLESLPDRMQYSTNVGRDFMFPRGFFDRLSDWMAGLFPSLALQASYSDDKADEVIKMFPSVTTDPYEAQLVQDSLGRWFLRVFTKDVDAAKLTLRLEIEAEAPEMRFVAIAPAMFFAEVRLSENMAKELREGHRPVFRATE